MKAVRLRTEHLKNPLGLELKGTYPTVSWNCQSDMSENSSGNSNTDRNSAGIQSELYQSAYRITASLEGAAIYDSGKVFSGEMQAILPIKVADRQRVTWQVQLWNELDFPGSLSEQAWFETGISDPTIWSAKWICPELSCDPEEHKPASYLKKVFAWNPAVCSMTCESDIAYEGEKPCRNKKPCENKKLCEKKYSCKKARLYVTALGLYEVYLNGTRVGDFVLAPGSYDYEKHLAYQTYDVTGLLREGTNTLEVILGDGWYRSVSGVDGDRNLYGTETALLLQLEADGQVICATDESWLASQAGPLRENDMQQGEVYDGRIRQITDYHEAKLGDYGYERLFSANTLPVKEKEHFEGRIFTTPNGETVIDYGQNLAGYVAFSLKAREGQTITLTHGETLDENGNFTQENFQDRKRHKEGGTRQQIIYTCREGENHYKSRFTSFGFRYAKVETEIDLTDAKFTAIAVYSDMEELAEFTCSNDKVNQLAGNSIWSMKSNFCDIPTDCPTRERAAWTGDMGVFIETGLTLADCYPVVRKWLGECRLAQKADGKVANIAPRNNKPSYFSDLLNGAVGWGDASILVPYAMYRRDGDVRILEENYDMMKRWYAFLEERAKKSPEAPKMPAGMGAMAEAAGMAGIAGMTGAGAMTGGAGMTENAAMAETAPMSTGMMSGMQLPEGMEMTPELMEIAKKYLAKMQAAGGADMSAMAQAAGGVNMSSMSGMSAANLSAMPQTMVNPYEEYTINTGVDYGEWCEPDVDSQMAMRTPQTRVATAYFAHSGKLLAEIARILGHEEDAEHYEEVSAKARSAFRMVALQGKPLESERQAEYIRAITFGLLNEEEEKEAAEKLNQNVIDHDYHLNTGFLSTPDLCRVLADYGYVDTAYKVLLQEGIPGWLYQVNRGATTIWEVWDGIDEAGVPHESLNHYSKGAVTGWLIDGVCGIRANAGNLVIAPKPNPQLTWAHASYRTPSGLVESGWVYDKDGSWILTVRIPYNQTAEVILPDGRSFVAEPGEKVYKV